MLSDRLAAAIPEYPLGGWGPAGNRVIGGLDDLRQKPVGTLALRRLLSDRRQVVDDADEEALAVQRAFAHRQIHGKCGAVLALSQHFTPNADDAPFMGFMVM